MLFRSHLWRLKPRKARSASKKVEAGKRTQAAWLQGSDSHTLIRLFLQTNSEVEPNAQQINRVERSFLAFPSTLSFLLSSKLFPISLRCKVPPGSSLGAINLSQPIHFMNWDSPLWWSSGAVFYPRSAPQAGS